MYIIAKAGNNFSTLLFNSGRSNFGSGSAGRRAQRRLFANLWPVILLPIKGKQTGHTSSFGLCMAERTESEQFALLQRPKILISIRTCEISLSLSLQHTPSANCMPIIRVAFN